MFRWLNKQGVVSDAGYVFQRVDRFCYHYVEGERVLRVDVEPGLRHEGIWLPEPAVWLPPHGGDPIEETHLTRIRANVSAALSYMGIPHKLH